jgi:hypothetical protein
MGEIRQAILLGKFALYLDSARRKHAATEQSGDSGKK